MPDFEPLRMPRGKPTVEKLTAAAAGKAQTAAEYADVFISAGLPADFIAQLTAATAAMMSFLTSMIQQFSPA